MKARYEEIDLIPRREMVPGATARFVHTDTMTVAFFSFAANTQLPEHSHPHEQVTRVVTGSLYLTVEGEERKLVPGEIAIIPGGAVHSARTTEATEAMDIFNPIREDYR